MPRKTVVTSDEEYILFRLMNYFINIQKRIIVAGIGLLLFGGAGLFFDRAWMLKSVALLVLGAGLMALGAFLMSVKRRKY